MQKSRDPFGILPVSLDRHLPQGALLLPCLHQNRIKTSLTEVSIEPLRQRPDFQSDADDGPDSDRNRLSRSSGTLDAVVPLITVP